MTPSRSGKPIRMAHPRIVQPTKLRVSSGVPTVTRLPTQYERENHERGRRAAALLVVIAVVIAAMVVVVNVVVAVAR